MPTQKLHASASEKRSDPDPSVLTTQALLREIELLREVFTTRQALDSESTKLAFRVVEVRLDGMDRATNLIHEQSTLLPSLVDEKVAAQEAITRERFEGIQTQFRERDVRSTKSSEDDRVALNAALSAAKEAVGKSQEASDKAIAKSEVAFTKQIDQIVLLVQTGAKANDDKLADMKDRLVRLESEKTGAATQVQQTQAASQTGSLGTIAGILGGVLGAGGAAAGVAALLLRH